MTPTVRKVFLPPILLTLVVLVRTFLLSRWEWSNDYKISRNVQLGINCSRYFLFNDTAPFEPNCQLILAGHEPEICRWVTYHRSIPTDQEFLGVIKKNRSITDQYPRSANSLEEEEYPIAFSISIHKNVYQFENLLRLIYWPQNLYCIHVDRRAPPEVKMAVELLIANFSNVFLTRSEPVYWAGFGVLRAVLNCMNDTLIRYGNQNRWKYFINLSGMDFPLKTNLELVRILKLLNGSNDVEFAYEFQFSRYWFSYRSILDSNGHPYTHVPETHKSKPPPPHRLKVYKGNLAAALSRDFVEYLFKNQVSLDFIDWLRDTDTADEHLWATLNYNRLAKAPGSFPAECHNSTDQLEHISRYAVWRGTSGKPNKHCSGRYVRDVCIFGVKDVKYLTRPGSRKELFANKFYMDYQSAAFACMQEWFRWKTKNGILQVDEQFYTGLPNVVFQRRRALLDASQLCENWNATAGVRKKMPLEMKKYIKGGVVKRTDRL